MKTHNKITFAQTVIIILCTILIITTNYIFSNNIIDNVREEMLQNEYEKLGGEENYHLLQEIQKQEMQQYIENIKAQDPELLYNLHQQSLVKKENGFSLLSWEAKNDLVDHSATGSRVSVIEFSDFECPYCIEFHNNNALGDALKSYGSEINYVFKNFPLPDHQNGYNKSLAAKCVESLGNKASYYNYIDILFQNNSTLESQELGELAATLNIDKSEFEECYNSQENNSRVQEEFEQGRKLEIQIVPTTVIINNTTGEFEILSGKKDKSDIEEALKNFF